jgi:hypothetical protein
MKKLFGRNLPALLAHLDANRPKSAFFHEHLPFCPRLPIHEERQNRPAVAFPGRIRYQLSATSFQPFRVG